MMIVSLVALQGECHDGQKQGGQNGALKRWATVTGVHTARIAVGQLRVFVLNLQLLANTFHGAHPGAAAIRRHCAIH